MEGASPKSMNRRKFLFLAAAAFPQQADCTTQSQVIQYAVEVGTAAASIGTAVRQRSQELGDQTIGAANALIAAAERWKIEGLAGALINALNTLRAILESIPYDVAATVAALIPIVIAAIETIFALFVKATGKGVTQAADNQSIWHPAQIPHHFGHSEEKDFRDFWNQTVASQHITGVLTFG